MRVAHLILTYTDPEQTGRMIKRLSHEDFDFYIHVDKKCDIGPYLFLKEIPNVYFIRKRTDVKWAGFDTVLATFECIKEIVATGTRYDFINFLSGQDYPIKPASFIHDFFLRNIGKEFLSYRDIANDWTEGKIRMERYYLSNYQFVGKHAIEYTINKILPKRKLSNGMHPYGQSMFWMLSPEAAMYVVNKVNNDRALKRFLKFCWGSDEVVFQTVLLNSPYKNRVINNNYRYIDWSAGGPSPKILDAGDAENLIHSNMLFARKFDIRQHPQIFDIIDRHIV